MKYEVHVTVDAEGISIEDFREACWKLKVKPIEIILKEGAEMKDLMTSGTRDFDDDKKAFDWAKEQEEFLNENGFKVLRVKIETQPEHPLAPKTRKDEMPDGSYFETHIQMTLVRPEFMDILEEFIRRNKVHLSRNAFKQQKDGHMVYMLTYRSTDCYGKFYSTKSKFILDFMEHFEDVAVLRPANVEFILFDSKQSHDDRWLQV